MNDTELLETLVKYGMRAWVLMGPHDGTWMIGDQWRGGDFVVRSANSAREAIEAAEARVISGDYVLDPDQIGG